MGGCEAAPGTDRIEYLKRLAASNIKRLSHTGRKKAEIEKWVDDEFLKPEEMTTFVQTIPLAVIAFITRCLDEFGKLTRTTLPGNCVSMAQTRILASS
jgi:hypothetical protein